MRSWYKQHLPQGQIDTVPRTSMHGPVSGVRKKGGFQKMFLGTKNRNDGTKNRTMDPQNQNAGTKNGTTVPKTGTRAHSPKPPFYKTALLSLECAAHFHRTLSHLCVRGALEKCLCFVFLGFSFLLKKISLSISVFIRLLRPTLNSPEANVTKITVQTSHSNLYSAQI